MRDQVRGLPSRMVTADVSSMLTKSDRHLPRTRVTCRWVGGKGGMRAATRKGVVAKRTAGEEAVLSCLAAMAMEALLTYLNHA